jgi:hypothetical protein
MLQLLENFNLDSIQVFAILHGIIVGEGLIRQSLKTLSQLFDSRGVGLKLPYDRS